jgi:hypothetical protein
MTPNDSFRAETSDLSSPIRHGFAVAPTSTNADLTSATRALWVGGGGDLNVMLVSGATVLLKGVPGGSLLPLRVARVLASGTTATSIVALL